MRRRHAMALVGGALSAAALPAMAQTAKPTTLTLATWQLDEPGNSDWWRAVIAAFEKANPDVKIDAQQTPNKDFQTQMTVRYAANRPPDIIQLSTQNIGPYAQEGWLEPLDDRIKGTAYASEWSGLQRATVWDGHTRGILMSNSTYMLFYNEEHLKAAGVTVPTTFQQYLASIPKVTNRDKGVFGVTQVTAEHPTLQDDFLRHIIWQGHELIKNGKYNLSDPAVVATIETYRKVMTANAPQGLSSAIARQLFVDGKIGFLVDGPWVWSWLAKARPEVRPALKMVAAPFPPPIAPGGLTLHISAGIDKARKDMAWRFIEFATTPEWQRQFLILTGQPPGRERDVLTAEDKAANPHLAVIMGPTGARSLNPAEQPIRASMNEFYAAIRRGQLRLLSTAEPTAQILKETEAELQRVVPLG